MGVLVLRRSGRRGLDRPGEVLLGDEDADCVGEVGVIDIDAVVRVAG